MARRRCFTVAALRVFRPEQAQTCRRETLVMRALSDVGLPVPEAYAEGVSRNRPAVLMQWCAGSILQDIAARPWRVCKHWPAGAVGEPVLRDLYGALHHVAAQSAHVVTMGSATPAARERAKDKPCYSWEWQYLIEKWPAEIDELAARPRVGLRGEQVGQGT